MKRQISMLTLLALLITFLSSLFPGFIVQASETSSLIMNVDYPTDNYSMSKDLSISGWALDKSGISKINIYIDSSLIGETKTGLARQDVASAYPEYPNGALSGFLYTLKLNNINPGEHILTVEAVSSNGNKSKVDKKISVSKTPIIAAATSTKEQAKTWAKNKNATEKFISLADIFWELAPERGGVDPAVAYAQSAVETGYGKFGGILNESYNNPCGLKNSQGGADNDPDAHMKFPDWKTGITAQLDHLALYAGAGGYPKDSKDTPDPRHFPSIKGKADTVESLGGAWASSITYGFTIAKLVNEIKLTKADNTPTSPPAKPLPKVNIESLKDGDVFTSDITISGWSLNASGVKSVAISLDGKPADYASIKEDRPDLNKLYSGYGPGVSFNYTISSYKLSEGTHKINVESVGNDNTKTSQQVNIVVKKLPPIMYLEHPDGNNIKASENTYISGWAVHASGVKEVRVLINGKYTDKAEISGNRQDVNASYPDYKAAVGFVYYLDINKFAKGTYDITIEVLGNDNTKVSQSLSVSIEKLEPRMWLENVGSQYNLNKDSVTLQGWALNPSGVKEINIMIDDKLGDKAFFMQNRSDVNTVFKGYPTGYGFSYLLDYDLIPNGKHTVAVEVVGNDGSKISQEIAVNVNKPAPKAFIELPSYDSNVKSTLSISGFVLMDSKIKAINILADNVLVGQGAIAGLRPDANAVFPGYKPALHINSEINIISLRPGIHEITMQVIGMDGSVASNSIKVNKVISYAIDIGHNVNYDYGAVGIRNENDTNMEVGLKVIKKLEDLGYNVINVLPKTATSTQDSLKQRTDKANANNVDLYVSIHFNKFNSSAKGSEAYTVSEEAKPIAEKILKNLENLGYTNRGVKTANFYVINNSKAPSLLVECAFLDNKEDMERYDAEKIADAIVQAILK